MISDDEPVFSPDRDEILFRLRPHAVLSFHPERQTQIPQALLV